MKYYRYLYVQESLVKKKDKVIKKLENHKFQPSIHIITMPQEGANQLEIYNSVLLLQPDFPHDDFFVVGITKSYDDAIEMVELITQEVYNETKGTDIRSYIISKEQEG